MRAIFRNAGVLLVLEFCVVFQAQAAEFNCSHPPIIDNFDINTCCRIPEINLGKAPQKCDTYIKSLQAPSPTANASANAIEYPTYTHVCYPECIYRETGSLVDGEIQMGNVRKFLSQNVNWRDKDIVPHIVSSFETCLSNIKGHMKAVDIQMYAKLREGCSPYASMMYSCVNAETFLHCPPKMWKNESNCNLAKSFASQCNPLPHVPLPIV